MVKELKWIPARFYCTNTGKEPVQEWLMKLSQEDRLIVSTDIKDVEFAWPTGMPLIRSLEFGLWKVR